MSGVRAFAVAVTAVQTGALAVAGPMFGDGGLSMFADVLLTAVMLGAAAVGPAFVYARTARMLRAAGCAAWACVGGGGWLTLSAHAMGTWEHGAGTALFVGGAGACSLTAAAAAESKARGGASEGVEGFMLWFGTGLFFGGVSLWAQATGEGVLGAWFEWACAMSHSAGMCAFYARHPFEEPLAEGAATPRWLRADAPLLGGGDADARDESWV